MMTDDDPTRLAAARRRLAATGVALALAVSPAGAQVRLPDFGDSSQAVLSAADERAIGREFMLQLRANVDVVDDPEIAGYIQSLGYRLLAESDHPDIGFTFFVVGSEAVNAFAAPGGYVGVNSGLITATESESELASVLAHEIAHVTQRHIARSVGLANKSQITALAGVLAAILIGTQNPQAGRAAAAATIGATVQKRLDFTRANELEADRVGMQYLASAGFDPRAMPSFFEKLQTASRYYRRPPEFLSTHPVTTSRIADTRGRAEQYPYRHHEPRAEYFFVREKLRVLTSEDPGEMVTRFEKMLESPPDLPEHEAALRYGLALALTRAGRPDEANDVLRRLVEAQPERVALRAALADNELRSGDVDEALRIYSDAFEIYPDNKLLLLGYGRALLERGRGAEVLRLLDDYATLHGMDASLHWLAAQAHEQQGNEVESHAALAEHYYRSGALDRAIHQLRLARRHPDADYYRGSRIDARLEELEAERARRAQR